MALPSPTVASAVTGYMPQGTRRVIWVSTMAAYLTPTSAEITAGTDYSAQIAGLAGWSSAGQSLDLPNLSSTFTPKVAGPVTADDSSLTFNMSSTGAGDVRSVFTRGVSGYVVICPEGIISSGKCSVFPVKVLSANESADMQSVATLEVAFTLTLIPAENIAIPIA